MSEERLSPPELTEFEQRLDRFRNPRADEALYRDDGFSFSVQNKTRESPALFPHRDSS